MGGLRAVHVAPPRRAIGSGGAAVRCRPHSPSRASLRSAYSLRAANKGGRCRPPLGRAGHRTGGGTGRERTGGLRAACGGLMPLKRLPVICPSRDRSKPPVQLVVLIVCRKPLARRVVPKKAAADDVEIKTPFARIKMRSANCTKQAKGGHSK